MMNLATKMWDSYGIYIYIIYLCYIFMGFMDASGHVFFSVGFTLHETRDFPVFHQAPAGQFSGLAATKIMRIG